MPDQPQPKLLGADGLPVPHTTDPSAWARHFVNVISASRGVDLDERAVASWFTKAIAVGFRDARETLVLRLLQDHRKVYGCPNSDAVRELFDKSKLRPPQPREGKQWVARKAETVTDDAEPAPATPVEPPAPTVDASPPQA
jgi:hypothetical protein